MQTTRHLRAMVAFIALLAAIGVVPVAADAQAAPTAKPSDFSAEFYLTLHGAMVRDAARPDDAANLTLYLRVRDGQWQRAWGKGMTVSEHPGIVTDWAVGGDRIRFNLELLAEGDFWVKGAWPAFLTVQLKRGEDGRVTGNYAGTFNGNEVSGNVEGDMLALREAPEGFSRPAPDEHPRVLFRKQDIPALRKKLDTPLGKAYRRVASDPINLGVLCQLTGEKKYAERAMDSIRARYTGEIPVYGFGSGGFGHEIFMVAVTYDLCVDAWPEPFVKDIRRQLEAFTERQQHVLMTSHANFHPCSNYYGPGRGVPGVVSMALWGEKGPMPRPLRHPVEDARPIGPMADYTPGRGVGVHELSFDSMPASGWVWTGPLRYECSRDVLASLGGYAKAKPVLGTRAEYLVRGEDWFKDAHLTFSAVPESLVSEDGIDLDQAMGEQREGVAVFFTALRVREDTTVTVNRSRGDIRVFVSGVELALGEYVRLQPGVHPMLVELRSRNARGALGMPLTTPSRPTRDPILGLHRIRQNLREADQQLHEATGMNPNRQLWLDRGWWQNVQHYRWGIGDGGFKAETGGYANISSWYPSVYASMYRNFFGYNASPYPDVTHIMPRQMLQAVFASDRIHIDKLNSALSLNLDWMAVHFPMIPDRYKPHALWAWNRMAHVGGKADAGRVVTGGRHGLNAIARAMAFVNYPLDMEPVHPKDGMPLQWRADTFGFYVFRSGWARDDDFVGQLFLKAKPVVGWNHPNAGGFLIRGLGHQWTNAPESRNGVREQYSVVLLPDDETNIGGCAKVSHYEAHADGSGSLTMDMNEVYAAKGGRLYTGALVRNDVPLKESGITGLRAMAFDYSGLSGAPAMVVMVDKIEGGGKKVWTWQKHGQETAVHDHGFTLRHPDASMHATFIAPRQLKVEHGAEALEIGTARKGFHGTVNRVKVTGGDSFFVVLTFQKGEAPEVKVEGTGLGATVHIGRRTVRFDGQRIILGQ